MIERPIHKSIPPIHSECRFIHVNTAVLLAGLLGGLQTADSFRNSVNGSMNQLFE